MPKPESICAVCLLLFKPDDPTTAFHAVGGDILVHARCEDALTRCGTCGEKLPVPGGRLIGRDPDDGRVRAYHVGHERPQRGDHAA